MAAGKERKRSRNKNNENLFGDKTQTFNNSPKKYNRKTQEGPNRKHMKYDFRKAKEETPKEKKERPNPSSLFAKKSGLSSATERSSIEESEPVIEAPNMIPQQVKIDIIEYPSDISDKPESSKEPSAINVNVPAPVPHPSQENSFNDCKILDAQLNAQAKFVPVQSSPMKLHREESPQTDN